MPYPSTYSSFNRPTASDRLNSPSHSALHNTVSSAVGQIEQTIGLSASSLIGTLYYDIRSPNSNGGGHVQTANKGGTGQTTFTKGDLLVATSSSVLSKLTVGANNQILIANSGAAAGVNWGSGGIDVQSIIGSGTASTITTWSIPSGYGIKSRTLVELWGGGGSGGMGTSGAGGGGGGSYNFSFYITSALGASQTVLIGGGGASVASQGVGNLGGNTIFGASILVAYAGGGGGQNMVSGGSGGGPLSAGVSGTVPQSVLGGNPTAFSGYGGEVSSVGGTALYSGGGGGTAADGGGSQYGGAGGGGVRAIVSSVNGAGGISGIGGNGGKGSILGDGGAGSVPGGGGGAALVDGTGVTGQGGAGKAIITTWL